MRERDLLMIVAAIVLTAFSAVAAFNYIVNPEAVFPHEYFASVTEISRQEKPRLFRNYLREHG